MSTAVIMAAVTGVEGISRVVTLTPESLAFLLSAAAVGIDVDHAPNTAAYVEAYDAVEELRQVVMEL